MCTDALARAAGGRSVFLTRVLDAEMIPLALIGLHCSGWPWNKSAQCRSRVGNNACCVTAAARLRRGSNSWVLDWRFSASRCISATKLQLRRTRRWIAGCRRSLARSRDTVPNLTMFGRAVNRIAHMRAGAPFCARWLSVYRSCSRVRVDRTRV